MNDNRPAAVTDPLDDVLREAHRRGQVVLMHPVAGLFFVRRADLDNETHDALDKLNALTPATGRTKGTAS